MNKGLIVLNEVMIELKENESLIFANRFLKEYLSRGFGSLSKREIDILMLDLLVKCGNLEDISNFDLSLKLKITETKIKNLKYEANLRYRENTEEFIRHSFLSLLEKAKLKKDTATTINMAIEDNFLRNAISAKLKKNGSYTDTSFNSEIVKIHIEDFVYLLDIFYTGNEKEKIKQEIKSLQNIEKTDDFKKLFKKFLEKAVESAGEEIGRQGVLLGIGYLTGGVFPLVNAIKNIIRG